jgi:Dolichyl-phosphate-mannose-protein mannosyltransferase
MSSTLRSFIKNPIYLLLAVNILIGLFIFRDYGLTWDEPYFYSYGDALGYAYTPANWFSGHFDLNNSYGISGDDHKTRGPAYLFLARNFVYGLEALGSDSASAWHLVNFLFFQLGVYFLYRISKRWMNSSAAFATAAMFSYQPLLWGHAFINPKDSPFLTFFLASVCLGFEMVDKLVDDSNSPKQKFISVMIPAIILGIATSIRVLGPLAGLLVFVYLLSSIIQNRTVKSAKSLWILFISYGVIAILIMLATWPYLWESPLKNFFYVFQFMSDNPTNLAVLFGGQVYRASDLPHRYLPFLLATTLTEPVWFLFIVGLVVAYWKIYTKKIIKSGYFVTLTLILAWFGIVVAYVLLRRPAMYDGFRHFLFILPPVFIFIGFAFEFMFEKIKFVAAPYWIHAVLLIAFIAPGAAGIIQLHPYEYAYYNSFIGGTDGAFRKYETDYWLTCYKEAVEQLDKATSLSVNLFVKREAYIAATYANGNIDVLDLRDAANQVQPGDYVLVNTRTNEDRSTFKDAPIVIEIKRGDATFCIVRQIP